MKTATKAQAHEIFNNKINASPLSWQSIAAGVLGSLLVLVVLTLIGTAIGGLSVEQTNDLSQSGSALLGAAGIWLILSLAIALFCGAYLSVRTSSSQTSIVGHTHGLITATLLLSVLIGAGTSGLGGLAQGLANVSKSLTGGVGELSQNPMLQNMVHDSLGESKLKDDPKTVMQGILNRLAQGDSDSLKKYFADETNSSEAEVDGKIEKLKANFKQKLTEFKVQASASVAKGSLYLLLAIVVGLIGSVIGVITGLKVNRTHPLIQFH